MFRQSSLVLCLMFFIVVLSAANREQERLEANGMVLEAIMNVPDNIPQELLEKAECIITVCAGEQY